MAEMDLMMVGKIFVVSLGLTMTATGVVAKENSRCLRWLNRIADSQKAKIFYGSAIEPAAYVIHVDGNSAFKMDDQRFNPSIRPVRAVLTAKVIGDPSSYLLWLKNRGDFFQIVGHIASVKRKGTIKQWLVFRDAAAFEKFRSVTMTGFEALNLFEEGSYRLEIADKP